MAGDRSRRPIAAGWLVAGAVSAALIAVGAPAAAQDGQRSASISVSVTVVRSCVIASPSSAPASEGAGAEVRLSCSRGRQTALPLASIGDWPTLAPVAGIGAAPGLSAIRSDGLLLLSVNF